MRAYICVFNAEKINKLSKGKLYCAGIQFQNFGSTPAYEVTTRRSLQIFDTSIVESDDYGPRSTLPPTDATVIAPTQIFRAADTIEISDLDRKGLMGGSKTLVLFGEIEYAVASGPKEKKSTLFNLECRNFGTDEERFAPRGKLNDAT